MENTQIKGKVGGKRRGRKTSHLGSKALKATQNGVAQQHSMVHWATDGEGWRDLVSQPAHVCAN